MPTQTVSVKVEKTKVKQFAKVIEGLSYAEVKEKKPAARVRSNIQKGKHRKGEKASEILARIGGGKTRYDNADDLRRDAWQRGGK